MHLGRDALQTFGIGVIDQRGMTGRSEEEAVLINLLVLSHPRLSCNVHAHCRE